MIEDQQLPDVESPPVSSRGFDSLAARAQARRAELSARRSVELPVPGYQDMLVIEYRALTYSEVKRIGQRVSLIRDEAAQDLASYADQLLLASTNAWEITREGTRRHVGAGWTSDLLTSLGAAPGMTARQMLLGVLSDLLLIQHYVEYSQWLQGAEFDIDNEIAKDFRGTSG